MKTNQCTAFPGFMDLLLDAICAVNAEGRFVFASAACERIFGYTAEEMVGKVMIDMVFPEDRERTLRAAQAVMSGHLSTHFENRYVRKDGRVVHIMWSARWSEADQLRIAVARDVTQLKRAESMQAALYAISEAAHLAEDLPALFQRIHQIVAELLPAANFFVALYDEEKDELSFPYYVDEHGQAPTPQKLDSGTLSAHIIRTGQTLLLTPEASTALARRETVDAGRNSLYWLGAPLNSHRGTVGALVVRSYSGNVSYTEQDKELLQFVSTQIASAIERKQMYARLQHSAQHDQLTNLPNRELLHDRLGTALARARREHRQLALLWLDLDDFKLVNDSHGHAVGDLLLQSVAGRLTECVRESDTVARVGGDEFVVLLDGVHLPEHAATVAEKILTAIGRPIRVEGHGLCVSPSIGIALYPAHGQEAMPLLREADKAMYVAKKNGGNLYRMAAEPIAVDDAGPDCV